MSPAHKNYEGTLDFRATKLPRHGDSITIGGHMITFVEHVKDNVNQVRVRRSKPALVHAIAEHINRFPSFGVKAFVMGDLRIGLRRTATVPTNNVKAAVQAYMDGQK